MYHRPYEQSSKIRLAAKIAATVTIAAVPALAMAGPAFAAPAPAPGIVQADHDWQHNQDRDHDWHHDQDRDRHDHDHDWQGPNPGINPLDWMNTGSFGR